MMLLSPKLAPFFGENMQLLKIEESVSSTCSLSGSYTCFRKTGTSFSGPRCSHSVYIAEFKELNPKAPNNVTESGGGYAKGPCKFMVTDGLNVALVSPTSAVSIVSKVGVPISNLVEKEVRLEKHR